MTKVEFYETPDVKNCWDIELTKDSLHRCYCINGTIDQCLRKLGLSNNEIEMEVHFNDI